MNSCTKSRVRVLVTLASLSIALWFSPLGTAHAELVVSAPNASRAKTLELWYDHHIPACFRSRTRLVVRQLTDREMTAYLQSYDGGNDQNDSSGQSYSTDESDDDIDGVFENDPPRIALRLPDGGDPDMLTFAHEYGHYVWFNILDNDDRDYYGALYKKQRAAHHLVTRYAATDLEEGFAEAFSFYAAEPAVLARRDSKSYQFFAQWVSDAVSVNTHDNSDH